MVTTFRLIKSETRMASSLVAKSRGSESCNASATGEPCNFGPLGTRFPAALGRPRHGWGVTRRDMVSAMPTGERAQALRSNPVFAGLPARELDALAGSCREDTYRAREFVFL